MAKKTKKQYQRYLSKYGEEFPCLGPSRVSEFNAHCSICCVDFVISHGGRGDCVKHINSAKHCKTATSVQGIPKLTSFSSFTQTQDFSVINAEVLFANFVVEHNLPFTVADHMGPLLRKMFPNNPIAKGFHSGQTKTKSIIQTLARDSEKEITEAMQNGPYSLATDGSSDMDDVKLYPLVVRYFDNSQGVVSTVLLCMPECRESTAAQIFQVLDEELKKRSISWENCVSFGADNANVMQGLKSGLASHLIKVNPNMYIVGCACHLLHLAAEKAERELPVHVEETLIDIYFYLDKSSKRKAILKDFQSLHNTEIRKILKHVSTRWLSLKICIDRLLMMWPALTAFFKSELQQGGKKQTTQKRKACKDTQCPVMKKCMKMGQTTITTTSSKPKSTEVAVLEPSVTQFAHPVSSVAGQKHIGSTAEVSQRSVSTSSRPAHPSKTKQNLLLSGSSTSPSFFKQFKIPTLKSTQEKVGTQVASSKLKSAADVQKPSVTQSAQRKSSLAGQKHQSATSKVSQKRVSANSQPAFSSKTKPKPLSGSSPCSSSKRSTSKPTHQKTATITGQSRLERICLALNDESTKLYCLFLSAVLPVFDEATLLLQNCEPCIHILHRTLLSTVRTFMAYLVKPASIKEYPLLQVPYTSNDHQRADDELFIGHSAREFLIDHQEIDRVLFFSKVRAFFIRALEYMLSKFPLSDDLLQHAEVADIRKREMMKFSSVKYFAQRMQCLGLNTADKIDELQREFISYQMEEFPQEISNCQRVDKQWNLIGNMVDSSLNKKYPHLTTLMKAVLVVFHSNADCERIFSFVTKTKTRMRSSMTTKTLSDLIVQKQFMLSKNTVCYEQKYSTALLQKCKSGLYQKRKQGKSASDEGAGGSAE